MDNDTKNLVEQLKILRKHNHSVRSSLSDSLIASSLETVLRSSDVEGRKLHPFLNHPAYIDDEEVLFLNYGVNLFQIDGVQVNIPNWYRKVNLAAAQNLESYDAVKEQAEEEKTCGEGKNFAVLANEPHTDMSEEALVFSLAQYLQSEYPQFFADLYVLQEGQYAAREPTYIASDGGDPTDALISSARTAWTSDAYAPLNKLRNDSKQGEIVEAFRKFLEATPMPVDAQVASETLRRQLSFYFSMEPDGHLNPVKALRAITPPQALQAKLDTLRPGDIELATSLINDPQVGFRGALAYKLYVDGKGESSEHVKVFGLEQVGVYLASCALNPICILPMVGKTDSDLSDTTQETLERKWKPFQPYRDEIMAAYAFEATKPSGKRIVPLVLASVGTHLPIVRRILCEKGITSVTLEPTGAGVGEAARTLGKLPTTPFSPFFFNGQSAFSNLDQFGRKDVEFNSVEQFYGDITTFAQVH